ncbi:alpha-1,3-arabinosyltransferase XAT3-like isoform X2 [Aristolochia californica]|uniref:alpha-1,3-arabinosyltransferase XAT3-like isoform X2 n=1 Tax=Aristolochia californica TaxID=171875 RepID=UPI0035D6CFC9
MFGFSKVKRLKSFAGQNVMKLGNGSVISCMLIFLCIFFLLKARFCPASTGIINTRSLGSRTAMVQNESSSHLISDEAREQPICDISGKRSDTCDVVADIRVVTHGRNSTANSTTVTISGSFNSQRRAEEWRIRPYARKGDVTAMNHVTEILLQTDPRNPPRCTRNHTVPALIFSTAGYTGNFFHDFTDVLVPLFITSHRFHGEVQFLVTDMKPLWISKFQLILRQLSRYQVIDVNHGEDGVHCFRRAIIGTIFHQELGVNPLKFPTGSSILGFKQLLRRAFSLERETVTPVVGGNTTASRPPRLLIISRKRSRAFMNVREIVDLAKSLGFEVVVAEANLSTDVGKFARLVNSCDVMLGVHGAGLTNMIFLPHGAVLIQLIPFGRLEWVARSSFKDPAVKMKVRYLEYSLREDETSLSEQYPRDDPVLKHPLQIHKQGWSMVRSVYLVKQNVKPHLGRLRSKLLESLELLKSPQESI